jgi:hypothetical protein
MFCEISELITEVDVYVAKYLVKISAGTPAS